MKDLLPIGSVVTLKEGKKKDLEDSKDKKTTIQGFLWVPLWSFPICIILLS